jgi:hypothetical protein
LSVIVRAPRGIQLHFFFYWPNTQGNIALFFCCYSYTQGNTASFFCYCPYI